MCNTSKHRIAVDLNEDGSLTVWTPVGPIHCFEPAQAVIVLRKMAKHDESYYTPRNLPREYERESFEAFMARGGKITQALPATKKPLTKFQSDNMSLEDLEL